MDNTITDVGMSVYTVTESGAGDLTGAMCGCGGNGAASVMPPDVYGMSGLHRQVSGSGSADGIEICCGSASARYPDRLGSEEHERTIEEDSDTPFERGALREIG